MYLGTSLPRYPLHLASLAPPRHLPQRARTAVIGGVGAVVVLVDVGGVGVGVGVGVGGVGVGVGVEVMVVGGGCRCRERKGEGGRAQPHAFGLPSLRGYIVAPIGSRINGQMV